MGMFRLITKPLGCLLYMAIGLLVLALIGLWGLSWLANRHAMDVVRYALESQTGYTLAYETATPRLWLGDIEVTQLRIFNPSEFAEPSFIEAERIFIDADPLSLLFAKTFLVHEVDITITRLNISFNKLGQSNLTSFLNRRAPPPSPKHAAPPTASEKPSPMPAQSPKPAALPQETPAALPLPEPPPWRIARLRITLQNIRISTATSRGTDIPIQFSQTFEQITDWNMLSAAVGDALGQQAKRMIVEQTGTVLKLMQTAY